MITKKESTLKEMGEAEGLCKAKVCYIIFILEEPIGICMSLKVNDILKDERELENLIKKINRYILCSIMM